MDLEIILVDIQRKERDLEYFDLSYVRRKKLKVAIIDCPYCTKPFVPTKLSKLQCIPCKLLKDNGII